MIKDYLHTRLKAGPFAMLALLLALLVTPVDSWINYLQHALWLAFSFYVFRFLDDAGSVAIDRLEHPERTYLQEKNYFVFRGIAALLLLGYLTCIFFLEPQWLAPIGVLFMVSIAGYALFSTKRKVMFILPLLKYPVLLWCLLGMERELSILFLASSSFFMMAAYDLLESPSNSIKGRIGAACVLMAGLLLFQSAMLSVVGLVVLVTSIAVYLLRQQSWVQVVPLLIYPICYILIQTIFT